MKRSYASDILLKKMLMFTMDFLLPTIGYKMNDQGVFYISKAQLKKEIERSFYDALLPTQDMAVPVFCEYESETESLSDLREQFLQLPSERFLDIIVNILGVMNRDGVGGYSFVHHHVRDYFAAYYIVQRMREAIAIFQYEKNFQAQDFTLGSNNAATDKIRHCLEPIFYEIPDEAIQSFVGEILGEHRNAPVLNQSHQWQIPEIVVPEQAILRQVLDMCRYSTVDPHYLLSNIVEILKRVRKNVAGEVFDGLDLRNCRFYETICSIGTGDSCLAASFRNCKAANQTFLFEGHIGKYIDFTVFPGDSSRILTLGDDEQVCLWDRATHRMLSSFVVGNSVAQEGNDSGKKISSGSVSDFLTRFYEDTQEERRSYIAYVKGNGKELLLSEASEGRIIDDMRFSPFETYICGVWGGDTIRLFSADDGSLCYKYIYSGEGQVCHVVMPQEAQIILHVKRKEEFITRKTYRLSEWAFYRLDMQFDKIKLLCQYETCRKFDIQANEPMSAFDAYQKKCLLFSGHQVKIIDFESGKTSILDELSEEIIPEYGEFMDTQGNKAAIYWCDAVKIYERKGKSLDTAIHRNPLLEQCIKPHIVDHFVYVIDEDGNFHEWNLKDDIITENILPTVKLDIEKIHTDGQGHILVEYSNNCILTIDEASDSLLSTFYEAQKESMVETSTYLEESHKFFLVLQNPDYEQVLLYDPVSGQRQRIEVAFKSQLNYRAVLEEKHRLYIAFDKKVIAVDLDSGRQQEIWHASAGEEFFDFHVKNEAVYLLLQWIITCRMPKYLVYERNAEGGYEQTRQSPVLFISEEASADMLLEKDIEFFVKDPIANKEVVTARGMFIYPSEELKEQYSSFEAIPEESTRLFYYVDNYGQYAKDTLLMRGSIFMEQNSHKYVTVLKDYAEVHVYHKDSNGKFEQVYSFMPYSSEDGIVNLYHAVMGTKGKAYCSTSEKKLVKVNPKTGKILKQFSWLPGIIVTQCDFSGTEVSDNLKEVLGEHGAWIG